MFTVEEFLLVIAIVSIFGFLFWHLLCGSPASDVDKANLIKLCDGDEDAESIVRTVLKKKNLQRILCIKTGQRIEALLNAKHSKAIVSKFLG